MMEEQELKIIAKIIKTLSEITENSADSILNILSGTVFSEEDCENIKRILKNKKNN